MANYEMAEKITALIVEKTGSCLGSHSQKFTAKEQKQLFGRYFGKGLIVIDAANETITHVIKTAFGCDSDWTAQIKFDGQEVFNNR
jgi:hypothetical protein